VEFEGLFWKPMPFIWDLCKDTCHYYGIGPIYSLSGECNHHQCQYWAYRKRNIMVAFWFLEIYAGGQYLDCFSAQIEYVTTMRGSVFFISDNKFDWDTCSFQHTHNLFVSNPYIQFENSCATYLIVNIDLHGISYLVDIVSLLDFDVPPQYLHKPGSAFHYTTCVQGYPLWYVNMLIYRCPATRIMSQFGSLWTRVY
jgi:hypothetical protein